MAHFQTKSVFALVTPKEASGKKVQLTARRIATKIYIEKLWLTEDQRAQINALYANPDASSLVTRVFDSKDPEEQCAAAALLASEGLDPDGREELGNRWSSRWGRPTENKGIVTRRELFQWCVMRFCECGQTN